MSKKHNEDFLMSRKYATFVANEYAKRIDKAIKYLRELEMFERKFGFDGVRRKKLLNILEGSDKE